MNQQYVNAINRNMPCYMQWLEDLIAFSSTADSPDAQLDCANYLVSLITHELQGTAQIIATPGAPVVIGRIPGSGSSCLLCYNHYDVQPAGPPELWGSDPFSLHAQGDKLIARGTADNKGQLVSRLAAIKTAQQLWGELPLTIELFIEGEEETGSPHIAEVTANHKHFFSADSCLWESGYKDELGRYHIGLGAKGIVYLELTFHGPRNDLHSIHGGMAPNPLWDLVWALSTLKDCTTQTAAPVLHKDARQPDATELNILSSMNFPERQRLDTWGIPHFTGMRTGAELQINQRFSPQINICGISGGYSGPGMKTVIPASATAKLDIRLVPHQQPQDIIHALTGHLQQLGFNPDIKVLAAEPPAYTAPHSHLVTAMTTACQRHAGYEPQILLGGEGSGPMHAFTDNLGIPTANGIGVGNIHSLPHAPGENILTPDFIDGTALLLELFVQLSTDQNFPAERAEETGDRSRM